MDAFDYTKDCLTWFYLGHKRLTSREVLASLRRQQALIDNQAALIMEQNELIEQQQLMIESMESRRETCLTRKPF